ncbi:hypothetical protein HRbin08_01308 [bacterium HR08]|nr:hypothetical protein HRbin08_01308 [bacterium HR08]
MPRCRHRHVEKREGVEDFRLGGRRGQRSQPAMRAKEQRFFDVLKSLFIGAPVEGESGDINLMRIKVVATRRVATTR